jgi:hypothetical protein
MSFSWKFSSRTTSKVFSHSGDSEDPNQNPLLHAALLSGIVADDASLASNFRSRQVSDATARSKLSTLAENGGKDNRFNNLQFSAARMNSDSDR